MAATMNPRETWTDERLDDLKGSVDGGFRDNHDEFRALRAEIRSESQALRAEIKSESQALREEIKSESHALREEIKSESHAVRGEIGALNRSIHQLTTSLVGAMLVGFLGTIAAIVTQL
jgi:chromosome segregation ATPase